MASLGSVLAELDSVGLTPAKIDAYIAQSVTVREAVITKAKEVQTYWKSIAPVSDRKEHPLGANHEGQMDHPGDYRDSIIITYDTKPSGYFVATVITRDPKAHWLEYGSIHNPEHGYAQRVVNYFGGSTVGSDRGFAGVVS